MKRTLASDYDFMSENITINLAIERLLKGGGIRYVWNWPSKSAEVMLPINSKKSLRFKLY